MIPTFYAINLPTQDIAMNDELLLLLLLLLLLILTAFSQCIHYKLHERLDVFSQSTPVEQCAVHTYTGSASSPALHQTGQNIAGIVSYFVVCLYCATYRLVLGECHSSDNNVEINVFVYFWRNGPQWATVSSFTRFLDHTQRRTTVGRTPLDE